mmetsp:Transcript_1146/g.2290  ORF Transcript_1146/g.2290 Transcript_1146/m.2290 type:complete len:276 (+) Transcript_1146:407-1234(+)
MTRPLGAPPGTATTLLILTLSFNPIYKTSSKLRSTTVRLLKRIAVVMAMTLMTRIRACTTITVLRAWIIVTRTRMMDSLMHRIMSNALKLNFKTTMMEIVRGSLTKRRKFSILLEHIVLIRAEKSVLDFFSDDTCTTVSETSYYSLAGTELPYSSESLISENCISCLQQEDDADQDGDDAQEQEVRVKEICEEIYQDAGKCETYMGIQYPTESACNYIEGIKITREDGIVLTESTRSSKGASVAIGLFATTAILLGAYVYYLRTKLGGTINLSSM